MEVDDCARYLLNDKDCLRYHESLRDGLPIASGVFEGACCLLVRDRVAITGARWRLQGGEAVLKLRSVPPGQSVTTTPRRMRAASPSWSTMAVARSTRAISLPPFTE